MTPASAIPTLPAPRPGHRRGRVVTAGLALGAALSLGVGPSGASAAPGASATAGSGRGPAPAAYDLPAAGIRLEGIGVDRRSGAVYVSATNQDGTIYRAEAGSDQLQVWVGPRPGANGRGIAVDSAGRVFVAGGPSGTVRVFDADATLLAEPATGVPGSFLNDLWVAADGAVYVTDSSQPVIRRLSRQDGVWTLQPWLDVTASIPYTPATTDFDLGGITITPGGRYLVIAQGTTGQLWRVEIATRQVSALPVTDAAGSPVLMPTADGIALRGDTLYVVQNFARRITTLRLCDGWARAELVSVTPTASTRTFTTAKLVGGRLLAVDSTFGLAQAPAADRVVAFELPLTP